MIRLLIVLVASTLLCSPLSAMQLGRRTSEDEKAAPAAGAYADTTIREMLKRNYDAQAKPNDVEVTFSFLPTCVIYDEQKGTVTTSALGHVHWKDERLTWNPRPVGGVTKIELRAWDIWSPDLLCYNTIADSYYGFGYGAQVTSDGFVSYVTKGEMETPCNDKHCKLTIGSWGYNGFEMKLKLPAENQGLDLSQYDPNCPWKANNVRLQLEDVFYPCCSEPYPTITITYDVERA